MMQTEAKINAALCRRRNGIAARGKTPANRIVNDTFVYDPIAMPAIHAMQIDIRCIGWLILDGYIIPDFGIRT